MTGGVDGPGIFGSRPEGTVMKPLVWTAEVSRPAPEAGSQPQGMLKMEAEFKPGRAQSPAGFKEPGCGWRRCSSI